MTYYEKLRELIQDQAPVESFIKIYEQEFKEKPSNENIQSYINALKIDIDSIIASEEERDADEDIDNDSYDESYDDESYEDEGQSSPF